VGKDINTAIFN